MKTNKVRLRVDYAPLNLAVSTAVRTPSSPLTQVFVSADSEWEPDREVNPCIIWPMVYATASDGSWANQYANKLLTEMKWYVNGVEISQHPDWNGTNSLGNVCYSINEDSTNYRGSLTINRNVALTEVYTLHFEAVIADTRLGTRASIVSDDIVLSTTEKANDSYAIEIEEDASADYDPIKDKLSLYNYKVAHGLIEEDSDKKAAATDANAYLRTIPVRVKQGENVLGDGYTLKLYRVAEDGTLEEITANGLTECVAINTSSIVLDLRLIERGAYMIKAAIDGSEQTMPWAQFTIKRTYPKIEAEVANGASILPSDTMRYAKALITAEGNIVDCPASIIKIDWYTDTTTKEDMWHNEGGETKFSIADTGLGKTYLDDWMDIWFTAEWKGPLAIAEDEESNVLTDEDGNVLIFN